MIASGLYVDPNPETFKSFNCVKEDGTKCDKWEECDQTSCVLACHSVNETRCIFPFQINGTMYYRCSRIETTIISDEEMKEPSCATKVNETTNEMEEIEDCNMSTCPLD
ncbi:unnamed protein product [Lepeophtheirus salmonis]|uniref:(salmon louse) hypothetical protein n=3 Tax=Lepeophtheirus salmonis TaxID=72036 RepID=A0A7R8CYG0_LEPSM|nr:unnamed protein product [Lepeophtheirus salmonis]CAF2969083.1 unnamed protein product [Lepeophtheirus salmonis]